MEVGSQDLPSQASSPGAAATEVLTRMQGQRNLKSGASDLAGLSRSKTDKWDLPAVRHHLSRTRYELKNLDSSMVRARIQGFTTKNLSSRFLVRFLEPKTES